MCVVFFVLLLVLVLSVCILVLVFIVSFVEVFVFVLVFVIVWCQGDVDDVFVEVVDSGKLVLLYWGVVWCLLCNQFKVGLFKDLVFIVLIGKFVLVYLDGDEEGVQVWGECFGVCGYLILIVLDLQCNEFICVVGGNDVVELIWVLIVVVGCCSVIVVILVMVLVMLEKLVVEDWQVLGDYGWEVDVNCLVGECRSQDVLCQLFKVVLDVVLQCCFVLLVLVIIDMFVSLFIEVCELLQVVLV